MKKYEYKTILLDMCELSEFDKKINECGSQGFKIINAQSIPFNSQDPKWVNKCCIIFQKEIKE